MSTRTLTAVTHLTPDPKGTGGFPPPTDMSEEEALARSLGRGASTSAGGGQAGVSALAEHEHNWRMVSHHDYCHAYRTIYSCECGANRETYDERSVWDSPWSEVWMLTDDGKAPRCKRCAELLTGLIESEHHDNIVFTGAA